VAIEQQDYYEVHEGAVESQNYARECMGILCMLVKVLTGLQIAGCKLQKNARFRLRQRFPRIGREGSNWIFVEGARVPSYAIVCIIIIIIYLPNNTTVRTSTSVQFKRAGQQCPTAALKRLIKQLLLYIFYHTSKILQTRKLEKSIFSMSFRHGAWTVERRRSTVNH